MNAVESLQLEIRQLKEDRDNFEAMMLLYQKERDAALAELEARDKTIQLWINATRKREAEAKALREALGLLTTLHPTMEIDPDDPLGMAQQIVSHVRAALATGGHDERR